MKIVITESELSATEFRGASEIWLAAPDSPLCADSGGNELCLWRGEPMVSHDMLSEGTHEQNVRRIWMVVADIDDPECVLGAEQQVRAHLESLGMRGEFYPAEQIDTHGAG